MLAFIREAWALARPYWKSSERWLARLLLAVVISLSLGEVYLNVLINQWYNAFYDTLQHFDKAGFVQEIVRFCWLVAIYIAADVYKTYLGQMLRIKWRAWMTSHYLSRWLSGQNYYRMQVLGNGTDNPDQRISEDIDQFVQLTLDVTLGMMSSIVTLFSFVAILWKLSGPLDFTIYGMAVHVPGYLVWVAIAYALLGTWITIKLGRPLVRLNFEQQRYEANFRFSLVRLRENTESIAFYRGETQEQKYFLGRFQAVVDNFWQIMRRQKILNWFSLGYGQIATVFPIIVVAPRYFAKKIELGGLMQTASAFGHVQGALSYIIDAYTSIATWKATSDRLRGFNDHVQQAEASHAATPGFTLEHSSPDGIRAEGLSITLPDGSRLLDDIDLAIRPGDTLLITGPSGSGKSTLLRALAGLWPFVKGHLALPADARMLFLPQKPYMPLGTLRESLGYPGAAPPDDAALREVMELCRLGHLADRLEQTEPWAQTLSLGEQQRIAFARIFLIKPDYVFLDEATSALDGPLEARLYEALGAKLPASAVISVGHRNSLRAWHKTEKTL